MNFQINAIEIFTGIDMINVIIKYPFHVQICFLILNLFYEIHYVFPVL